MLVRTHTRARTHTYTHTHTQVRIMMPGSAPNRRQTAGPPPTPTATPGGDAALELALTNKTHDVYFCGGTVPCSCPESALACVRVEDSDSCDAKARSGAACDAREVPRANGRLSIRSGYSNLWFFDGSQVSTWADGTYCSRWERHSHTHTHTHTRLLLQVGAALAHTHTHTRLLLQVGATLARTHTRLLVRVGARLGFARVLWRGRRKGEEGKKEGRGVDN